MPRQLLDQRGQRVSLGNELGRGGEGAVFEVAGRPGFVAKLYHNGIDEDKAEKLGHMIGLDTGKLAKFAAWPVATLREEGASETCGIIMPRITGGHEVHLLYGPAHRKQFFPAADWRFLVRTARNTAAAFAKLHALGIVIGDVNQGNLIVQGDACVTFIDCDSFQFTVRSQVYRCGVGVPHFTPPELQGISLGSVNRTANHDAFGLAILLFHLLFMGRHPFAGRYLGRGDMPIEKAIQEGRFAYAADPQKTLMQPPPNSVARHSLPPEIYCLFDSAFTGKAKRPTAEQWASALERLESGLVPCRRDSGHWHNRAASHCPWCQIIRDGGPNLFISASIHQSTKGKGKFDVQSLWKNIEAVQEPAAPDWPIVTERVDPKEYIIPDDALSSLWTQRFLKRLIVAGLASSLFAFTIKPIFIVLLLACTIFVVWFIIERRKCSATVHLSKFQRRLSNIVANRKQLQAAMLSEYETARSKFHEVKKQLSQAKDYLQKLPAMLHTELANLSKNAEARQRQAFFESKFIEAGVITGIGEGRVAILRSYGIETAWDLNPQMIGLIPNLPSFGPQLASNLAFWRNNLERQFKFDPKRENSEKAQRDFELMFAQKAYSLQDQISLGIEDLQAINQRYKATLQGYLPQLQKIVNAEAAAGAATRVIAAAIQTRTSLY